MLRLDRYIGTQVFFAILTVLGVIVGLNNDLTGVTQEYNVKTFRTFEYFALAALLLLAELWAINRVVKSQGKASNSIVPMATS